MCLHLHITTRDRDRDARAGVMTITTYDGATEVEVDRGTDWEQRER